MRVLLLAPATIDHVALRAALASALGATAVDVCHAAEAAVTWVENRPCDLLALAGAGVSDTVARLRRVSRTLPLLALVDDLAGREAGLAWLAGADDVLPLASLASAARPDGLDELRRPDREALRRTQRVWYAGSQDALRQQLTARLGQRVRDVGLSGEGLAGLTTQDVEAPHSAVLVVNALTDPGQFVLGVRRVKRTYSALAVTVIANQAHHDAFRRAGADECLGEHADVDHLLHAVGRAQAACRGAVELDAVRTRETRLRCLLENLPEAVVLVSPEHAVLAVNLAALRLLGAQDARQVLGAELAPWLESEDGEATSVTSIVDSVTGGTACDAVLRTRHLAEPRRIHLRAVPFQRESGGPPAALVVLRDVAALAIGAPATVAAMAPGVDEIERRTWDETRAADASRVATLEAELDVLRADAARVAALEADLRAAAARVHELEIALECERHDEIELQRLRTRVDALARVEAEDLPALHALVEQMRARDASPAAAAALEEAQLQLGAATTRIGELERHIATLESDRAQFDESLREPAMRATPDGTLMPMSHEEPRAHQWLLEHVAGIGVLLADRTGRIVEANAPAARLCGYASVAALMREACVPAPMQALAGDDLTVASRFELCLQLEPGSAPVWVAGVRLPLADEDVNVSTWWLAEVSGRGPAVPARERPETVSAVLEVATAECSALVASVAARPILGPRPIDAPRETEPAASRALGRAQVMLSQLTTMGRRRATRQAAVDVAAHLRDLAPMLQRLAGDELAWRVDVPTEPVHACVAATDLERCLTALVASVRDALPLGGQLSVSLAGGADAFTTVDGIVRADLLYAIEAQGYGLTPVDVPAALPDLAQAFGATLAIDTPDSLTTVLTLRMPRAFVVTHAA